MTRPSLCEYVRKESRLPSPTDWPAEDSDSLVVAKRVRAATRQACQLTGA